MASEPPSPSASSAPPDAEGDAVSHNALSNHPLWQRARGGGGGGGKGPGPSRGRGRAGSENGDVIGSITRERISITAQEMDLYQNADGADSMINSDDEEETERRRQRKAKAASKGKRPAKARPSSPGSVPASDTEPVELDNDDDDADADEGMAKRGRIAGMMGAAAFGGGGGNYACSEGGESVSEQSEASSKRQRAASKQAFPVRGVTCVGCALNNRISAVDRFVRSNIAKMADDALWKMAALAYKRDVVEPAEAEGAPVPPWGWKEVRAHYELHSMSNLVQRYKQLRTLQLMRSQLDASLVRNENGHRELDRASSDLMLKVIQNEMRLRDTLDASAGGEKKRGRE